MITKTSAIKKNQYFQSLQSFQSKRHHESVKTTISNRQISSFYCYDSPIYISALSGITLLVTTHSPHSPKNYEQFMLHRTVKIEAGVYFNFITISNMSSVSLSAPTLDQYQLYTLNHPYTVKKMKPAFTIEQIYALYYQVKEAPYHFANDHHPYCELTIVEQGELETIVDGKRYILGQNEAMLYQANQVHSQNVLKDGITTYITIMFEMNLEDERFFNRTFSLTSRQLYQLEQLILVSNEPKLSYQNDILIAQLKLFVLSLTNDRKEASDVRLSTMKENYDQHQYEQVMNYVHQHPEIQVETLVQHFGISRSTLQLLFKRMANQTPKAYIETQRFKKARQLIQESSYTLEEISRTLGYTSQAAFTRAFKKYYQQTPSQYAKSLYKHE